MISQFASLFAWFVIERESWLFMKDLMIRIRIHLIVHFVHCLM